MDDATNLLPDIRAPYVGAASFAHKGGVHADAASKSDRSYEHLDPSLVGNRTRVLVSDMSGRSSIMLKAKEMGVNIESRSPEMKTFLEELKKNSSFEGTNTRLPTPPSIFFYAVSPRVPTVLSKSSATMWASLAKKVVTSQYRKPP